MYSYSEMVKYSVVDKNFKLPLYQALKMFQNCINLHSAEIGMDFRSLLEKNKAWVLVSWKIKIRREIDIYEQLEVGTWSAGYNKMFGDRVYTIYSSEGEPIIEACTKWVLINIEARIPQRIKDEDLEGYATGDMIPGLEAVRKLNLSEDKEPCEPVKVLKSYIDSNGHMNNTAYFTLAYEYIPEDLEYNTVDCIYVKETTEGTVIIPYIHKEENGMGLSFVGEDGTVFTKMRFYKE